MISVVLVWFQLSASFLYRFCSGMSVGMPVAPTLGVGTNIGMSGMLGIGMDPTAAAAAGLGVTPGLGIGTPDVTATMGLGSSASPAAPPIATECLLVSNLFDANKSALLLLVSLISSYFIFLYTLNVFKSSL